MAINNLITFRKGIATEWSSQNPTLSSGEPGYDGTNNILKIGDGDTAWNSLNSVNQLVSEDSPQLGGDLDLNTSNITGVGNINIDGNITAVTGSLDTIDLTPIGDTNYPPHSEGRLFYDQESRTITLYNDEADISLQIGQEQYIRVRNNTPDTINNGSVVRINGAHNGLAPTIVLASADTEDNSDVAGVATHDIESSSFGYITRFGFVRNVVTSGIIQGGEIFVSTTSGEFTDTAPTIPNFSTSIGHVISAHPLNGTILVTLGKHKLGGGDVKSINGYANLSGIPYIGALGDTNAMGLRSTPDFVYNSGNGNVYIGGNQVLVSGDNISQLVNDTGYLTAHPSISAASSSDNSGRTYIQDVLLDSNGHVTGLSIATETVVDTDTTYSAGSGLSLDGTTFNALTATTTTSGITTLSNTINTDQDKALTPKAVNDAGYLTAHPTIIAASSVDNSNGNVIQDITLDSNGHVTALGSVDLDSRYYTETEIDAFNYVDGGGTANYIAKWSDTDTLTSGIIYDDGTNVGIGTASPGYKLDVNGTFSANSINVNDAFTFPTADGSADQYLKTDGLGNVTWSTIAGGGGISNVVEDTTPQLGGTLDLNGNNIEGYAFQTTPTGTIIGASGWIYQSGQQVLSNGSFGTHIGDAQFTQNVLRAQTTDATLTNLTIGTQSGILLASNRTYNFTVNIVGRRTNGQDHAGYKLEGMLVNDGYGTQILGSPVKTTFYESDTSWDAQVAITGAGAGGTDYLLVRCQGATSKNVNWVAHADMLEVGGNIDGYTEANILGVGSNIVP